MSLRSGLCLALLLALQSASAAYAEEGLGLQQAIEKALSASEKLRAAQAGVEAARGSETQSGLLPNPELSIEAENFAGTGPYRGARLSEFTYGISQQIELGGKRGFRQASAAAERKAAEIDAQIARLDVVGDVTQAYFELLAAQESLKLADQGKKISGRVLADVTRRVQAARDPLFQQSRAELAQSQSVMAQETGRRAVLTARRKLGSFWGDAPASQSLSAKDFYAPIAPDGFEAYAARLPQSPVLARYAVLREAREAELRLAQAGAVPDLRASLGMRQFVSGSDVAVVAGVSLPIPVFNQNQGEITRARAETIKLIHSARDNEAALSRDLLHAWGEWDAAFNQAKNLRERALPHAQTAYDQALSGYRRGGFQYLDVLETQRALFDLKTEQIATLLRAHKARAGVERLAPSSPAIQWMDTP